jgi:hypothetical protein
MKSSTLTHHCTYLGMARNGTHTVFYKAMVKLYYITELKHGDWEETTGTLKELTSWQKDEEIMCVKHGRNLFIVYYLFDLCFKAWDK